MKIAFFVNEVSTEIPEYTTTRLAIAAARGGHEVWYVGAGDIEHTSDGSVAAHGYPAVHESGDDLESFLEAVKNPDGCKRIQVDGFDAVMLRNDSIEDLHERPWAFNTGMLFGQMLKALGVCVVNDPTGLQRAGSKIYLHEFPESVRPRGLVSRNQDALIDFVKETGPTVLKPLYGAKGRNVFLVEGPEDPNINQMIEAVLEDGYAIAQERIEGAEDGDIRLFLVDGEALVQDGKYAAVRRVPEGNDVRANISAGAHPTDADIGDDILEMVDAMRDRLKRDGMFFVGVDIIGSKVVEINAESAGGLQSVEHFTGIDFAPAIIDALVERATRENRSGARSTGSLRAISRGERSRKAG